MAHSNRSTPRYDTDEDRRRRDDWGNDSDDARQYRREHYTRQSGRWGGDEPSYGRQYGERPEDSAGGGHPNYRGPQYEQGGQYPGTRETQPGESLRSRSADPGQSSYGGFHGEDTRRQRQQYHYGDERSDDRYGYSGQRWGDHEQHGRIDPALQRSQRISPKGYVRSDERIREDVCERLSHSGLDVSDVTVQVSDGTVTLEGTVPSRRVKHAIEDCVDDCLGVNDIQNHVRIGGTSHPDNTRMQ